jgi:hypothetical protein
MIFNGEEYTIQFWQGESLGSILAIDTETTIAPFTETPDLVTFQVFDGESLYYVDRSLVGDFLKKHVTRTLVFANAPFDIDVLRKFTEDKYLLKEQIEKDKNYDINILYRLMDFATTGDVPRKYSLAYNISRNYLGRRSKKKMASDVTSQNLKRQKYKKYRKIPRLRSKRCYRNLSLLYQTQIGNI